MHDWHLANGGELIEAGPWMRAWWYRWAGDSVGKAYIEEMRLVRQGVGHRRCLVAWARSTSRDPMPPNS